MIAIAMRDVLIQGSTQILTPPAPLFLATTWPSRLWVSTADGVYRYEEHPSFEQQDYVPPMPDLQVPKKCCGVGKDESYIAFNH